ncbi:COMPASS-like H3K4 histone methylase component WDR5B {ECO:0000303/PubMed:19567704} Short=AtWDR5B {ECO:0000303/PubMed:19567704} [Serendipita indica DSM 11827]|nr:COMPASS-like H3K4 histone methylase component WDR5B {ECO:0000303/PubMed:19567704} Short=AtWDR5B {ECO:0000303/PubMed:19567704} [Serendipita indica DSM 11827]
MDIFRKIRKKSKKTQGTTLTPTTSGASASLVQASTRLVAPPVVEQDPSLQQSVVTTVALPTTQSTTDQQHPSPDHEQTRRSKMDKWLARVALMLRACEAVVTILDSVQAIKDNQYAWSDLLQTIREHTRTFQRQLDQLGIKDVLEECEDSIKDPLTNYSITLKELIAEICVDSGLDESEFDKGLTWKVLVQRIGTTKLEADTINGYKQRLTDARNELMHALILYVTVSVRATAERDILKELQSKQRQRPQECQPGTRAEILAECEAWSKNPDAPNILWIKAAPGAGKSTIASTLVTTLGIKKTRLGSSFFFRRQETATTTASALWQGIAYDLARHPTIRKYLADKMRNEEIDLTTPNINILFQQLVERPLSKIGNLSQDQLPVVIIDALDECGGLAGARSTEFRQLLQTLTAWFRLPTSCKLIVTSREEDDIARMFALNPPHTIDLLATQETVSQSKRDIQAFLTEELRKVATKYTIRSVEWPQTTTIETLAIKANGLFIWASTVIEYLRAGNPMKLLEEIIKEDRVTGMGSLYTTVLQTAFPNTSATSPEDIRTILGVLAVAKETLDMKTLTDLLAMDPWTVEHICGALRPVLEFDGGLRFRHQSFVDFFLNPNTTYFVPRITTDTSTGFLQTNEILNGLSSIETYIPRHLQYASQYWVDHLNLPSEETITLVQYVLKVHFLLWLEVASLLQIVDRVPSMLTALASWLKENDIIELISLAEDMRQFTVHFIEVISQSVAGIYLSALPLSPAVSKVHQQYRYQYPNTLFVHSGGYQRWSPLLFILRGHTRSVNAVAFSPDGRRVVSGSDDRTVRLWDVETGAQIGSPLEGHTGWVMSVAFSPDGQRIVSGSSDRTVRLWDVETGAQIGSPLEGHTDYVRSVAFSPDGQRIVSGSSDRTVRLWDVETGAQIGSPLEGHTDYVRSVAFSPDGQRIVSGSDDRTVRLWDVETGAQIGSPLEGHTGSVMSVAFSPDGQRIVSGSLDRTVRLWDVETGAQIGSPLEGHTDWVMSVAFSPDGQRIVSGSLDRTVRLWDVETGAQIGSPLEGHTGSVMSVAFSPDGQRIVSGSLDRTVRLWDVETGAQIGSPLEGHTDWVMSVAFSPDGQRIVSGSDDRTVRLWDVETGAQIGSPLEGHTDYVRSVAFSPDGQRIVSGSLDRTVRLWDVETGAQIGSPLEGHTDWVMSVAFSPDGQRIVSGSDDRTVRLWDVETGAQIGSPLEGHTDYVRSVAFSPDGQRIVSGSFDRTVRLWDVETGAQIGSPLEGHTDYVRSVAFSPDGQRIVSGSDDRTVRLWDVETGAQIGSPLEGHTDYVRSVAFSPDGQRIVSGSLDRTVRLWDVETGAQIGSPLEGHTDYVRSVAFSPDGQRIVSGSDDRTVRLWDVETGAQIGSPLEGHTDYVRSVAFSPDGQRIVSGSEDRTVRLGDVETGAQVGSLLEGHTTPVYSAAFSPDGQHIASGSEDRTVRITNTSATEDSVRPIDL